MRDHVTSKFQNYLYAMLSIVLLLGLTFLVVTFQQADYQKAVENRKTSITLAEELRQSSNDLTRLVRLYVITGNPFYKQQFEAVVEIRDGTRSRPQDYSLAYWDFYAIEPTDLSAESSNGQAVPLIELMKQAGITDIELQKLKTSKQRSDVLVQLEQAAIALVEQQPDSEHARIQAISMLTDENFLAAKADIMRPIIETEKMIIDRTKQAVDNATRRLSIATACLFILGALLVYFIIKLAQELKSILGCSIPQLSQYIERLGRGDFLTPINVPAKYQNSVLGWIASNRQKLAALNLSHFKAIVDSSDDAIVSKNTDGIVSSWNSGAAKMFGYSAEEMIGHPITRLIPNDRLHEEDEILAKISRGEKVDHFETKRMTKQKQVLDVSVTISPIFAADGSIIGASKIARNITKEKAAEQEIKRLAFYDTLTNLANRRLIQDRIQTTLAAAKRYGGRYALLFLDLDNFKPLNDTHGHDAGDELLVEVAKRLLHNVRASDTVGRFGGDEFVILLTCPSNQEEDLFTWLENIMTKLIKILAEPYNLSVGQHICSVSIGATVFSDKNQTSTELLKKADAAMYQAKLAGKNTFYLSHN